MAKLDKLTNVPRETIDLIEEYRSILIDKNKKINLISKNDEKIVDERHIIDSAQVYDLIDKNKKKYIDLGTGSGFPGIIISIMLKNEKKEIKSIFYEKSSKKSDFLQLVKEKFKLKAEIITRNIFDEKNIEGGSVTARAFKPIHQICEIMAKNFIKYNNLILFLGKKGKQSVLDASKVWDIEYKEHKSITSNDSLILNIKNIKKKIE